MFVGDKDDIANVEDNRVSRDLLMESRNSPLVHYEELPGGHATFLVGKDASYLDKVLEMLLTYNHSE
jgi:hypothetical protein